MVHVSAETLRKGSAQEEATEEHGITAVTSGYINADLSHLENGPHVTAETSRRFSCDGSITSLIEDNTGEPLSAFPASIYYKPT